MEDFKSQPLQFLFCENCTLVYILETRNEGQHFFGNDSENTSSTQESIDRAEVFAEETAKKFDLNHKSFVLEIGSSNGLQLLAFKRKSIPCVGYESNSEAVKIAIENRIDTIEESFGVDQAWALLAEAHQYSKGRKADLIIAKEALSQVSDLNDFFEGISIILKEGGVTVVEDYCPELLFDATLEQVVRHGVASCFSTHSLKLLCANHDLQIADVQYAHSSNRRKLRWTIQHKGLHVVSPNVTEFLGQEIEDGLTSKQNFLELGQKYL